MRDPHRRSRRCSGRRLTAAFLALGVGVIAACSDTAGVAPAPAPAAPTAGASTRAAAAVDALARGIALALADESMRRQLLEDLRDSPFPKHALHLPSYLRGTRGASLAQAASRASGVAVDDLIAAADVGGGLQLLMPRPMDRIGWHGTADIVVKGTALTLRERAQSPVAEVGHTVRGDRIAFGLFSTPRFPFIVLRPADTPFGSDPEAVRGAALRRAGNAVSMQPAELSALFEEDPCEGKTNAKECPSDYTGDYNGMPTPSGYTYTQCTSAASWADLDRDRVIDNCEYEVAAAMRPHLATSTWDCDLGREPYWLVEKGPSSDPNSLMLFYALSYYYDCGYDDYGGRHLGDSEFVWMVVRYNNQNRWEVVRAFLSAHWNSEGDSSGLYAGRDLEYAGTWLGQPVIWVAEDKHANYRSKSVCDSGGFYLDSCDYNSVNQVVEVLRGANIGSVCGKLKDAVTSRTGLDPYWNIPLTGVEYYWTGGVQFRGWYDSTAKGGLAYADILAWFRIGRECY